MQAAVACLLKLTTAQSPMWLGLPAAIPLGMVLLSLLTALILVRIYLNTRRVSRREHHRR